MTEPTPTPHLAKPRRKLWRTLKIVALSGVLLATLGLGFAYWQANRELDRLKDPITAVNDEAARLVALVGKRIALPDEKPTIATVEDKEKLKAQTFFKNAEKGDRVLMYAHNKKAILYRPSTDKIIEVAYFVVKSTTDLK